MAGKSTPRTNKTYHRQAKSRRAADRAAVSEAQGSVPAELVEFASRCQREPRYFIESCLSVVPIEGGDVVPFTLNPGQQKVMDEVDRQLREQRPVRIIVLKSRRQGISTLGEALAYWGTSCFPRRNGMVIAHKKSVSGDLFRIAKTFWDTDERERLSIRPEVLHSNELAIRFGVDRKAAEMGRVGLNSSLVVESAEGTGPARGTTIQFLHASEVASWQSVGIMASIGPALSKTPGSVGIYESTAEGVGNLFHKMWVAASKGQSEFAPVFLPWSIDPRCRTPVSPAEIANWEFADAEERRLYEIFKLTFEQLKWRRMQLASPDMIKPGVPPEDVFKQEYPITPEEAFLVTGEHFFLMPKVAELETCPKGVRPHLYRARIPVDDIELKRDPRDRSPIIRPIVRDDFGELTVWQDPAPGEDYVIGADCAQGLSHGDFHVAWVLRRSTLEFVARIKSRSFDADEFGLKLALLGWRYNTALVGAEINGPGTSTNNALKRIRYGRIWFDRDIIREDEPVHQVMGWRTSAANRRTVLERLEEEIRRRTISMPAVEFYDETRTFLLIDGKPQASEGSHDDEIMAAAITVQLHLRGGSPRKPKPDGTAAVSHIVKPVDRPVKTRKRISIRNRGWW